MIVIPVDVVLPAPSVPVMTNVLAPPTKVPVLLRAVVPTAAKLLTKIEVIPFVSLAVPVSVIEDPVSC